MQPRWQVVFYHRYMLIYALEGLLDGRQLDRTGRQLRPTFNQNDLAIASNKSSRKADEGWFTYICRLNWLANTGNNPEKYVQQPLQEQRELAARCMIAVMPLLGVSSSSNATQRHRAKSTSIPIISRGVLYSYIWLV